MKIFQVRITGYKPYPVIREYTERGSNWNVAISRAVRRYLKDTAKQGSKRLKNLSVQVGVGFYTKPTPEG